MTQVILITVLMTLFMLTSADPSIIFSAPLVAAPAASVVTAPGAPVVAGPAVSAVPAALSSVSAYSYGSTYSVQDYLPFVNSAAPAAVAYSFPNSAAPAAVAYSLPYAYAADWFYRR